MSQLFDNEGRWDSHVSIEFLRYCLIAEGWISSWDLDRSSVRDPLSLCFLFQLPFFPTLLFFFDIYFPPSLNPATQPLLHMYQGDGLLPVLWSKPATGRTSEDELPSPKSHWKQPNWNHSWCGPKETMNGAIDSCQKEKEEGEKVAVLLKVERTIDPFLIALSKAVLSPKQQGKKLIWRKMFTWIIALNLLKQSAKPSVSWRLLVCAMVGAALHAAWWSEPGVGREQTSWRISEGKNLLGFSCNLFAKKMFSAQISGVFSKTFRWAFTLNEWLHGRVCRPVLQSQWVLGLLQQWSSELGWKQAFCDSHPHRAT